MDLEIWEEEEEEEEEKERIRRKISSQMYRSDS
jgi:hypothetical protein